MGYTRTKIINSDGAHHQSRAPVQAPLTLAMNDSLFYHLSGTKNFRRIRVRKPISAIRSPVRALAVYDFHNLTLHKLTRHPYSLDTGIEMVDATFYLYYI